MDYGAVDWRRGFLRLWVALSVGWIAFGTFVLIQHIRTMDSPVELHPGPGGQINSFPGDTSRDEMRKAFTTYFREQAAKAPAPPPGSQLFELHTKDGRKFQVTAPTIEDALGSARSFSDSEVAAVQLIDHPTPNVDPATYDKMIDQMMAGYEPRTIFGALVDFIKLALIPPVALFLVGWTSLWVFTGFRRNSPRTAE
jgi:hypothetical protein